MSADLFQHDSEGNRFDPAKDTIMTVDPEGQPFYVDFNQTQYDRHLGSDPMILFFHASWCPLCRKSDEVLLEALGNLKGGIIWFKVDYDTEIELRKKYGITYQDSFVVIGRNGEVLKKRNGLPSAEVAQDLIDLAIAQ